MKILKQEMQRCVGHTAWTPEGRQGRSQGGGPLDFKYEIMLFLKAETTWPRIESDEGSNTLGIYEGSLTIKECCNAPRTNSIRMGEKSPRASSWSKSRSIGIKPITPTTPTRPTITTTSGWRSSAFSKKWFYGFQFFLQPGGQRNLVKENMSRKSCGEIGRRWTMDMEGEIIEEGRCPRQFWILACKTLVWELKADQKRNKCSKMNATSSCDGAYARLEAYVFALANLHHTKFPSVRKLLQEFPPGAIA